MKKPDMTLFHKQSHARRRLLEKCIVNHAPTLATGGSTPEMAPVEQLSECLAKPDPLLAAAEAAAAKGDVATLLSLLDNTTELAFVADNIEWLKALGKYEEALLRAYVDTRVNFSGWQVSVLNYLFSLADRPALLAAGDPLPGTGPFTVFRGVAGSGASRRLRSISWTADMRKAIWFAKRFAMTGDLTLPSVYETTVPIERVFAYYNGRKEQEFLCDIDAGSKLRRVWKQ